MSRFGRRGSRRDLSKLREPADSPGSADAPLLYVCEVPHAGPFANLVDGRLYATDRAEDVVVKKVHDSVVGAATEMLDKETLHVLKLRSIRFTLATHEGKRVLVVDANRAARKLFSRLEPAVRSKHIPGESEFAQGLTRRASAGEQAIARRPRGAVSRRNGMAHVGAGTSRCTCPPPARLRAPARASHPQPLTARSVREAPQHSGS